MIVAVTDNRANEEKYRLYEEWLIGGERGVKIRRLTPDGKGGGAGRNPLEGCGALVLTGGGDVDPALYGGDPRHPSLYEVSAERDRHEAELLRRALDGGIPVLGICRGMQLANVILGGTLIVDLEEAGYPAHRTVGGVKCRHDVRLEPASALARSLRVEGGPVASSHHQAVGTTAPGLAVAARSGDGVIEALELPGSGGAPRALLVQWHPERMEGSALSDGLRTMFFASLTTTKKT